MRQCRGKRKDNGKWAYGWYFEDPHYKGVPNNRHSFIVDKPVVDIEDNVLYGFVEVIPETVGQSIGLKDEAGVDIYVGDILKYAGYWPEIGLVQYEKAAYVIRWADMCSTGPVGGDGKVIGNRSDNPELLEVKNE